MEAKGICVQDLVVVARRCSSVVLLRLAIRVSLGLRVDVFGVSGLTLAWLVLLATGNGFGFRCLFGGLSIFRSVFSIWLAVRWVYTVQVNCNGGGNLQHKPLNNGCQLEAVGTVAIGV
ncbi:hypothetical protein DY000_02035049 [Brassica cretica]|uniref:Transmembrane protein n=1 Tax=Brassica cretica TaxID=69181 RepID=A0ABQ7DZB7_BRACR|nr:hypothetical protein DY000_02035049 [Brassica cretica]